MAATAAATRAFLSRARGLRACNARALGDLTVSSVGFGGYRVEGGNKKHWEAIVKSMRSGVNLFDTSPSYGGGGSERMIGAALREMQSEVKREELVLATKVGYIQGPDLEAARASPPKDVLRLSDDAWHCIEPDFIRQSVEQSSERLGTAPDVVLLHSPEYFLSSPPQGAPTGEDLKDAFYDRMTQAFGCLEDLVASGAIGNSYGISSSVQGCNFSVTGRPNEYEGPSLRRVLASAADAGGADSHKMRVVQVPLNLLESGPAVATLWDPDSQSEVTAAQAAQSQGVFVIANRPLNAIPPPGVGGGDWGRRTQYMKLVNSVPISPELALLRQVVCDAIGETEPNSLPLQQIALWAASSVEGVGAALCGARDEAYVDDVVATLGRERLEADRAVAAFRAVTALIKELSPHATGYGW